MKKPLVRAIALILALLTILPFAAACDGKKTSDETSSSETTTEAVTTAANGDTPIPSAEELAAALAENPYATAGVELIKQIIKKCYKVKAHYLSNDVKNGNGMPAVWGLASFMEACAEAYRLYPDDKEIAEAYKDVLTGCLNKYRVTRANIRTPKNGTFKNITYYNAGAGGSGDYYYDDNAWLCIQLLIGYKQLGDESLLEAAEKNLEFLWTGWDDVLDGGIYWDKSYGGKNTCANGPVAIGYLLAYQITNKEEYLERGKMIYDWMRKKLLDGSLYIDSLNKNGKDKNTWKAVYNQATPIYAGALLYEITGEEIYYKQAKATIAATDGLMFNITGTEKKGNLKVTMKGNPIYKAWCVGWMARSYVKFFEVDNKKVTTHMTYLEKVLDAELTTKDKDGYYDPYFKTGDWGSESKTDILQPCGVASTFLLAAYYDVALNIKTSE